MCECGIGQPASGIVNKKERKDTNSCDLSSVSQFHLTAQISFVFILAFLKLCASERSVLLMVSFTQKVKFVIPGNTRRRKFRQLLRLPVCQVLHLLGGTQHCCYFSVRPSCGYMQWGKNFIMCFFTFILSTLLWKKIWVDANTVHAWLKLMRETWWKTVSLELQCHKVLNQHEVSLLPVCVVVPSALKCSSRALHKPHLQNVSSSTQRVHVKAKFVFWFVFQQNKSTFGNVVSIISFF